MFQFFKKLKLYKQYVSIHVKIYLGSFVDYQHLQKYLYNWNITLNYCFIFIININGNAPGSIKYLYFDIIILPTVKNCKLNDSKSYVPTVPMIISKVLKYFSSGKISFFLFSSMC